MRGLALFLLGAAIVFRLWAVPSARFTGDESDYWFKSRQVATGTYHPVYGPEITGSAARLPGPAYYYLMAAPQALGASPYFGSVFVALLHGLAAWFLIALVTEARGARAGLIAAALVTFAPWDVLYGDRIWGSCIVPVWGCAALYAAAQSHKRPAYLGLLLFLAFVLPQLHLSVPVLWAACAVLLWFRPPPRWPKAPLLAGAALVVLAYLPPLVAELSSEFANTRKILAHSGGAVPWAEAAWAPVKVFGYAILYGSSEIGYHWARGYWGGGFSEAKAYFTLAGLSQWWSSHGSGLAGAHVVSVALAAAGWVAGLRRAAAHLRTRRPLDLETALTVALVIGLGVGATLLFAARKTYFPHYANILMPVLLAPIAFGLDGLVRGRRTGGVLATMVIISMAAMGVGTVRYYRQVDALNGLGPTLSMVDRVIREPAGARLRFMHFHNAYAWQRIAEGVHAKSLPGNPRIAYTVHNHVPFGGPLPAGGTRHGPVLLTRRPPTGPAEAKARPSVAWTKIRVNATHPDGRQIACRPAGQSCRYGPQPWQKFEPTTMRVAGRPTPLLFMHPVQGGTVRARVPVPSATPVGVLLFALSDDATRSANQAAVDVSITDAHGAVLATAQADNRPGLRRLSFAARTSTITVAIETKNEGARVFGFDVQWTP